MPSSNRKDDHHRNDDADVNMDDNHNNTITIGKFKTIPREVILQIFCYLYEGKEFQNLAMTCRLCYEVFAEEMSMSLDGIRLDYLNGVDRSGKPNRLIELYSLNSTTTNEKVAMDYDNYFRKKGEFYEKYLVDEIPKCTSKLLGEDVEEMDETQVEDYLFEMKNLIPVQGESSDTEEEEKKGEYVKSNKFKFPFVNTLEQFKERLAEILKENALARTVIECLTNFNKTTETNVRFIIAGGFVTHLVSNCGCGDIDIFTISNGSSDEIIDHSLKQVLSHISMDLRKQKIDYNVLKTNGTLNLLPITNGLKSNLCHRYPDANPMDNDQLPCQFVLRRVQTIEELMVFFDIDCCRFSYDFENVYTILEGLRSMKFTINFVARRHIHTGLYVNRAIKYSRRGLNTLCVDLHPFEHKMHAQAFIRWLRDFLSSHYTEIGNDGDYDDPHFNDESWNGFDSLAPYMYFDKYSGDFDFDEEPYYSIVLKSLDYWLVKCVLDIGLRDALYSFEANGDYRDGRWTNTLHDIQIVHNAAPNPVIESIIEHIERYDIHYFCPNVEELLVKHQSMYITEGYLDSHLKSKYGFDRCYLCDQYKIDGFKSMCHKCKYWNIEKKKMHRDLSVKVAIITGGRCKIGYETSLLLLRMKATVVVTTRFAFNALSKFQKEKDYEEWKDKLIIYPLNLKHGPSVVEFTQFIKSKFTHVDFLVNNAAQTVRRPIPYFKPLIEIEKQHSQYNNLSLGLERNISSESNTTLQNVKNFAAPLVERSLESTLEILTPEDTTYEPSKKLDKFGEPEDSRTRHTWNMALNETSTAEIIECQMVNSIAPTLLVSNLLELLRPQLSDEDLLSIDFENNSPYSYVINVTSHEGSFNTTGKTDFHIQTNLSKASLNMFTHSGANQLAKQGVLMNSVDVGWISSSIPTFKEPPLKCIDGAYRILHPILTNSTSYGKLFKDYKVVEW